MTLAPPPSRLRKITSDELGRLVATDGGVDWRRYELIDGEIVKKMPSQKNPHVYSTTVGQDELRAIFPHSRFWVRNQGSLTVSSSSTVDPDLAVLDHPPSPTGVFPHIDDALLVVEVSDTSVAADRRRKMHLYASGGLAEAAIINVVQTRLEVFHDPGPDPLLPFGHRYATVTHLHPGDTFSPLAMPSASIKVSRLF